MGKFKVKYMVARPQKGGHVLYYWEPKKKFQQLGGFKTRALGKELASAITQAEIFNSELDAWRKGIIAMPAPKRGTVSWLIEEYRKDEAFTLLAPSTRREYERQIDKLADIFGDLPAAKITRQHAKQFYHTFSKRRRQAKYAVQVARLVFKTGKDIGLFSDNPFEKMNIKSNPPREQIWLPDEIEAFIAKAIELKRPGIAMAVRLGADLGQRQGDILTMTWNQYDGQFISLRQSKTKAKVVIPCLTSLKQMLDTTTREATVMVINDKSKSPYPARYFKQLFRDTANEAGIRKELQYLDLRRTAVVRLAEAGCTVPEIASITGHKIDHCQKIVDTYLPKTRKLAENAILKLEKSKVGDKS